MFTAAQSDYGFIYQGIYKPREMKLLFTRMENGPGKSAALITQECSSSARKVH